MNHMNKISIPAGTVHDRIPDDLREVLQGVSDALEIWQSLTPLQRNEWICYVISPKKPETRTKHIRRLQEDLRKGKRRPCCWIGCIHRTDKELSPSIEGILKKRG